MSLFFLLLQGLFLCRQCSLLRLLLFLALVLVVALDSLLLLLLPLLVLEDKEALANLDRVLTAPLVIKDGLEDDGADVIDLSQ